MNLDFIKKHSEKFTILGLLAIFYLLFFHNLGAYSLLDVDETRYVAMSRDMLHTKDFMTLYLNGDFFFEKPPLYFWLESLSFMIFHSITEFTARFPVALDAMATCFLTYFVGKKVISRRFGVLAALILATCLEFLVLAKIAILDMVLATCTSFSLYLGLLTFFCEEKNKKFFWWGFYIFSGLAVLAKGVPGIVIPFGGMFLAGLISKKLKEFFRPQYFLVGLLLFFGIALPWHLLMFKIHDPLFFNEYIMKHHLARFINSKDLGREQPWYYFILMLLWGLIPWVGSFIAMLGESVKNFKLDFFRNFDYEKLSAAQKFQIFNVAIFALILLFFSSSSTKLMTYILPIYPAAAFLMAYYWEEYIFGGDHKKPIAIGVYILNSILILAAIVVLVGQFFIPAQLALDIADLKWLVIGLFSIVPLAGIVCLKKDKPLGVFISYVAFVAILAGFVTPKIFSMDYKFGQNDLIQYARYAQENHQELATFGFGRRYSLIYYYGGHVNFQQEPDFVWLKKYLKKPQTVVIFKNKEIDSIKTQAEFKIIKKGRKYSLAVQK